MKKLVTLFLGAFLTLGLTPHVCAENEDSIFEESSLLFNHHGLTYIVDTVTNTAVLQGLADDNLTYLVIPSSITITDEDENENLFTVTEIGADAFSGNVNIFKVEFPNTIISIGDRAFMDCKILNFEELPSRLDSIGEEAFKGCDAIKRIKLPETTSYLGNRCFAEMASLKRAILFSNVKEIPWQAFISDIELEEVYLPENLIKINSDAFAWCNALNEINFPVTLEEIGPHAFIGGNYANEGIGLKHIVLPKACKKIDTAFRISGVLTADIKYIDEIPDNAFYAANSLREVEFSPTLKSIGRGAFAGTALNELILPETIEQIEEYAFDDANIFTVSIGDKVTTLPGHSCGKPTVLYLGSGIKEIHKEAFQFDNLKILSIKALVPPIVEGGFDISPEQMRDISLIVENNEAKELYESHEYWRNFNIVVLDESTAEISLDGTTDIATAIYNASHIMPADVTNLTVSGHLSDNDFIIIKENMRSLMTLNIANCDNEIIPRYAFSEMKTLKSIVLPQALKIIEEGAFSGCSTLDIEEFPPTIEYIGDHAFFNNFRLTVSEMPENLVELCGSAFEGCLSLTVINFKDKLEYLGGSAFHVCASLRYVDLSRTKIKTLPGQCFILAHNLNTLLLPETLQTIEGESIAGTGMRTLYIPGAVKELHDGALSRTNIRTLSFGEGLAIMPNRAMADNKKLLTVNLPSSLKVMSGDCFSGSTSISGISCLAVEAPDAYSSTFEDIDTRTCILTVPVNSFFSYLSATGWGMFSNIHNSLEIDMPDYIEMTTISEDDYQDLVEEEENREKETLYTEEDSEEVNDKENNPALSRKKAVKRMLDDRQKEESTNLLAGTLFCKLNHGNVLSSDQNEEDKGYRVFIRSSGKEEIYSVKINNVEMIDKLDQRQSLVLPAGTTGKLVVNGGHSTTNIENIGLISVTSGDVYDLTGRLILKNATEEQIKHLNQGIYIVNGKKILVK